jgi:CheY-like chemotaxis protein
MTKPIASFKEAIDELPVKVKLTIVRDGQLVELLTQEVNTLPDVLFLDLNMPCKMDLPH